MIIALSVCLAVSLIANFSIYAQVSDLQTQQAAAQQQIGNLQGEKETLQKQIDQQNAPRIVTRLGVRDIRSSPALNHPWSNKIRLYIDGDVWNIGADTAMNCYLNVTLYQNNVVANQSLIRLGTISGASSVHVAYNIHYSGDPLTRWTIIPIYDNP
jgi:hypothetical protein